MGDERLPRVRSVDVPLVSSTRSSFRADIEFSRSNRVCRVGVVVGGECCRMNYRGDVRMFAVGED